MAEAEVIGVKIEYDSIVLAGDFLTVQAASLWITDTLAALLEVYPPRASSRIMITRSR